jgi:hypothetical protein
MTLVVLVRIVVRIVKFIVLLLLNYLDQRQTPEPASRSSIVGRDTCLYEYRAQQRRKKPLAFLPIRVPAVYAPLVGVRLAAVIRSMDY